MTVRAPDLTVGNFVGEGGKRHAVAGHQGHHSPLWAHMVELQHGEVDQPAVGAPGPFEVLVDEAEISGYRPVAAEDLPPVRPSFDPARTKARAPAMAVRAHDVALREFLLQSLHRCSRLHESGDLRCLDADVVALEDHRIHLAAVGTWIAFKVPEQSGSRCLAA